jgi:hypothetical protein
MLISVILLLGFISIAGLSILLYLYNWLYDNPHKNIIILVGITIILNLMIFVFCVISYSHIKISVGPQGPPGNRGPRGYDGEPGRLAVCGDLNVSSSENKFKIKNQQLRTPRKPQIIE